MKINRYMGFIFDGQGYITDHLMCKKVIKFNFEMCDDEIADECMTLCLNHLNEREEDV